MHQAGNTQEEERIAAKVQGQSARLAKILKGLAEVALVADRSGEVLDILAHEGDTIQAGDPALRMRGTGCRVVFELPREERTRARRLGFCVVEVEGYAFDCTLAGAPDETRVTVEIASIPPSFAGKPAHLARSRFEGAVVLPASAIRGTGGKDRVLLVAPSGRAETRFVAIADKSPSEVIVIQGLDAGDEVILEAPHAVQSGMSVRASQ
jgi:hypothetical protein